MPAAVASPYLVLDVETSINKGEVVSGPGGDANPYGASRAIWLGYGVAGARAIKLPADRQEVAARVLTLCERVAAGSAVTLVGHNFSFDLHHLLIMEDLATLDLDFRIWDTMTVEYYLMGQTPESRFGSLPSLLEKYGHPVPKDSEVTAFFKQGIGSDKITDELMEPYTKNDIAGTAHVYKAQRALVKSQGMGGFIEEMLDAQLLFTAMEQVGLQVNPHAVEDLVDQYQDEYDRSQGALTSMVESRLPGLLPDRKLLGDAQMKVAILGGDYPVKVRREIGQFKNGKPKFKTEVQRVTIAGLPGSSSALKPDNFDKLAVDTVLSRTTGEAHKWLTMLAEFRVIRKSMDTYIKGYLRRVDEHGVVRTSYNQTATPTGRVSSANVNLQNLEK